MRLVIDFEWMGQVFTALLTTGGLVAIGYGLREFHRQGMERVRKGTK